MNASKKNSAFWFAIFLPALAGLAGTAVAVVLANNYGLALFFLLPILVSFFSAYIYGRAEPRTFGRSYGVALLAIVTSGLSILVFGLDGLVCLVMALPLAAVLAIPGVLIGKMVAEAVQRRSTQNTIVLIFLATFPALVAFESGTKEEPPIYTAITSVTISAPIDRVWDTVIDFPKIEAPPSGIFRLGIAYPIEASIDGTGPGAIRRCVFSTGDFVEPVTHWNRPTLLAFDVTHSPPPLVETTPHDHIHPPHLDFMKSERGQFRLFQDGSGDTVLEGTTWFRHDLAPQWYWHPITDHIIHQIHRRVLVHIKNHVETPAAASQASSSPSAPRSGLSLPASAPAVRR